MTQQNSLDDTEPSPTASGGEADGGNEEYASIRKPAGKTQRKHWTWQNAKTAKTFSSPKLAEAVRLVLSRRDCGHIIFCDNVAVHYWLRALLVEAGIPESRIGVLNAEVAKTPLSRQNIAEQFNGTPAILNDRGEIEMEGQPPTLDVVIANATAYEGIDLQVRTCQVIHLDLPWEPATLQQRNGRAVRQGNNQAVIKIVYLLSDRSTDAVRLSVITGKIGWMRDLLKSADRETNNPAAGSEMTAEEMLVYLSTDPAEAGAAVALLKAQAETEARAATVRNGWTSLRTIVSRSQALRATKDEIVRTHAHKVMEQAKRHLSQIPADLFPWGFLAEHAERGERMLFGSTGGQEFAVWEGAHYVAPESDPARGFEIGRIEGDTFGLRWVGDFTFAAVTLGAVHPALAEMLGHATPEGYRAAWPIKTDVLEDADADPSRLWNGEVSQLGLAWAPETWRVWLWDHWGQRIVAKLRRLSQDYQISNVSTPHLGKDGLEIGRGALLAGTPALAFTETGWTAFLSRVADDTSQIRHGVKLTWTLLDGTAQYWWGRRLPRGLSRNDEQAGA